MLLPEPEELKEKLFSDEIFLLLASFLLHDIGMIPELFEGEEQPQKGDETNSVTPNIHFESLRIQ